MPIFPLLVRVTSSITCPNHDGVEGNEASLQAWRTRGGRRYGARSERAAALNAVELLRDPSHVRALTEPEFKALFAEPGCRNP